MLEVLVPASKKLYKITNKKLKVPRALLQPYVIAVFTVAIALLLKLLLDKWIGADTPFVLFFAAVMISAYYGDRRAGLVAIALAALVSNYFFLYPVYSFSLQPSNILRLGVFLIEGWAITSLIVALHAARRKAEGISLRLQESEEQFSLFMDNLPGVAFIKDIDGRHLYFNKTCKDIFNFTSEAWHGKTNDQLFPAALAAQCNDHDQAVISSRDKLEAIEFLPHNGNIIYYLISKFPIFNNQAEPVLVGGIGVDITERIQAEEALQESEIKFRSIFNGAPIAIALLDTERRILQSNTALQKMFGYKSEEILNLSVSEFTHPDDIAAGLELYQELISGKSDHYQREERYFCKDGELIWGRVSVSIIRNADNKPQFAICMVEDITKQKQAESALREALQRLNFHVENSPLAVVEWDSNFRVSRWSQEAENIFGWKSEEVLGKKPEDWSFVFCEDLADIKNVTSQLYENIENRNIAVNRNYTKGGSVIYCEWYNSALLDESGQLVSVLSLVLDVSDRKRAEVAASRASDRTARLQAVTASLSAALTPTEVAEVIVKQALSAFGACRGLISLLTDSQTELEIVGSHGYPQDVIAAWHSFPVTSTVPLADAVRMKKPIWLESIDMVANHYPEIAALKSDISIGAIAAIPLTLEKKVLGALGLGFFEPQKFSEEDCEFIIALARQCAQAIERAQLYNAEQKARAEAEASEQRFRFLAESIPQLVWTARADGWVDYFNQRWYKYTGLTPEQSLGWGWLDALHPDERQHSMEEWNKSAKNKDIYEIEKRVKGINDNYRWQLTRAEPMLNERGQVVKWFGTCTDIDDRKRAEASIQKTNERLKLLSETASNLLLNEQSQEFIDSVFKSLSVHLGLEIYLIYLINKDKQTLQLHGYGGISEGIAKDVEWLDLNQTVCGTVAQNQQPLVCENVHQSPDNKTKHLRSLGITAYACYPLMARDQFIGTLSFGTRNRSSFALDELELMQVVCDQVATAMERSRLISKLQQQAEDLASANRMKDEFLAVLSHELRTPLNSMLGWAKLLRTRNFDAATTNKALEIIERNAIAQAQLIEDILDVSRIIQGKLRLQLIPLNLIPSIEAAIDTVRSAADAKAIQIESVLNASVGLVSGDPDRLQQIVWNLLSNAIKFTPEKGSVEVRLKRVDSHVLISVIDTGKGITPEFLPYVFDRFSQADASITRSHGGLGLGLAIVRHLVELHGGTIYAESQGEGKGATFSLKLPLLQQSKRSGEAYIPLDQGNTEAGESLNSHSPDLPLDGLQVLVVDDETDARELVRVVLEEYGAKVRAVASVSEAIAAIQQLQPDILISDIGMPGEDGYSLMRQIRSWKSEQGGQIPAIALTAYAREEDRRQALLAGFQLHVSKPIEPAHLIEGVVKIARQTCPGSETNY